MSAVHPPPWLKATLAASEEFAELAPLLELCVKDLVVAAHAGLKPLVDELKAAGVAKMGVRQRLAKVLKEKVDEWRVTPDAVHDASASKPDSTFWASMIDVSEAAIASDCDFSVPIALDVSQYKANVATPRERAAAARKLGPVAVDLTLEATSTTAATGAGECGPSDEGSSSKSGGDEGVSLFGSPLELEQLSAFRERGKVAFGRNDYDAAEKWYRKAVALALELAAKAQTSAAGEAGAAGDGEATSSVLTSASAAAAMHEDHAAALSNLAACRMNREPSDPHGALEEFLRPLLAACPQHVKGRLRAGRCCLLLGRLRESQTHYDVAYRLEKPRLASTSGLQLSYAAPSDERDERRGLLQGPAGQPLSDLARQASDGKASASKLLSHCERTRTLAAGGRVDEALYLARSVCRACSHSTLGQVLLVSTLAGAGRLWEAQTEAEQAYVGAVSGDEELGVLLACVYARRGKLSEAEYTLQALVRSAPPSSQEPRAARALGGMRKALAHKSDGNSLYRDGDFERAAAAYSAALDVDVEGCLTPTLLANRAQARLSAERFAEALADCDGAIALDAGNAKLHLRRAACYVALRQVAKAREEYETVLKLDPSSEQARSFVEKQLHEEMRRAARRGYQRQRSEGDREGDREGDEHTEEDEIDPYEVLGLTSHEASTGDVKSAYRKLALKWHPDKHADQPEEQQAEAEAMFHRLNLANAVLTDPVKRRMYDAGGRVADIMR